MALVFFGFSLYDGPMRTMIWDYNGTIVDDAQLCVDVENKMLAERGMKADYSLEKYRSLFIFPVQEYYYKLGYTFEKESYDEVSEEFNRLYDEGFAGCSLVPGTMELLDQAATMGYRNVIISASRQDKLEAQVRQLGIRDRFAELIGSDNLYGASKIDRARTWMAESGTNPDDCHEIGDTLHDLETARALGISHCTLVACGHQSYEVLKKAWPDTVHTMAEVVL